MADFAKLIELFDTHAVSFVAVMQQFNTTTSMGRLMLNILMLSFANSSGWSLGSIAASQAQDPCKNIRYSIAQEILLQVIEFARRFGTGIARKAPKSKNSLLREFGAVPANQ